jgi:hypothetical protein
MRAVISVLLVVACGRPAIVMPAQEGVKRTVRYESRSQIRAHFEPSPRRTCERLVLDETVVHADDDCELELAIRIVDGDDPTCGVGTAVSMIAASDPSLPVTLRSDRVLDSVTQDQLRALHGHLGRSNGAFSFSLTELPWDAIPRVVQIGGVDYLDFRRTRSDTFHGNSDGGSNLSVTLRARRSDHAIACAHVDYDAHGDNFEYGGWSERETQSLVVDYGTGASPCPK